MVMYFKDNRALQDRLDGRRLADSLELNRRRETFNEADIAFVESAPFLFLATAYDDLVNCSFKGGVLGFVRVTSRNSLCFPDYDGNSMYKSLGNILQSPAIGMLFIKFDGSGERMRINGEATIEHDLSRLEKFEGLK